MNEFGNRSAIIEHTGILFKTVPPPLWYEFDPDVPINDAKYDTTINQYTIAAKNLDDLHADPYYGIRSVPNSSCSMLGRKERCSQ